MASLTSRRRSIAVIVGCLGFCGLGPVQRRIGIYPSDEILPAWTGDPP